MATYSASGYASAAVPTPGLAAQVQALHKSISVTAALTTSDAFNFGYLPAGARVVGGWLEATDMDTNATPTLTINVGDADDADRFFAASTVGQAGTASTALAVAGLGHKFDSKTLITGAPAANAATGAAGTLTLCLLYVVE